MAEPDETSSGATAFLLARMGAHVAVGFAQALEPLGIEPRHFGLLMRLSGHEGSSQQELGERLALHPTRMVFLIDDLETRGLVERRANPTDRRRYALHLTAKGRRVLTRAQGVAAEHSRAVTAGLTGTEQRQLSRLLAKLADQQGLPAEGLPGPGPGPRRPGP